MVLPHLFTRLARGTALVCALAIPFSSVVILPSQVQAQDALGANYQSDPNARMLLQADELVYDRDVNVVTAQGKVRIEYDGNRLVADKVTYNQQTRRMTATGNVEILERDGNRIYSDHLDVTDSFRDGFVNGLRVETTDNTRFAAESAERSNGEITTFNNGVYTACQACEKDPDKPVLWQIKARKIIWNSATKTVRFERGRFELFGMPLAYFPSFEMADPTVKRKSGFLFPGFSKKDDLGFGIKNSYFWALAPNYDLTLSTTAYTKQGFLTQAEWRHRLENGTYNLQIAGIHQMQPGEFDVNTIDREERNRGMVASKGEFDINSRWKLGWDVMAQTDRNFSRTYSLEGYSGQTQTSKIYLRGVKERNYFDLNFYRFNVQESYLPDNPNEMNSKQPWVFPSLDYSYTLPESVYGGELKFDVNSQVLYRKNANHTAAQVYDSVLKKMVDQPYPRIPGFSGTNARLTTEAEWKRTFITPSGLVITPLLALRADAINVNTNFDPAVAGFTDAVVKSEALRAMATAGLELRWPILFSTTSSTHILEPIAQIYMRNNERYAGQLPNEDAQSFVFDATNLFSRDKFSGYDRVEGGSRANFGLRYSGSFDNSDWNLYALGGQSIQLGGVNSFGTRDFVNVGADSGLEDARSDYVAMIGTSNSTGLALAARGRFDKDDLNIKRGELEIQKNWSRLNVSARYAYIAPQPAYGYSDLRQEVGGSATVKVNANWRVFGSGTYDLVSDTLVRASSGLAYDDECFTYSMAVVQTRNPGEGKSSRGVSFNISFRTLGDIGSGNQTF
ncbi:LPS-assembly protein LptD [Ochrobactrum sp. Marseille-Q0166]|uniref:LPS-assembly protein LptD n=1 Tax=Ochrobactrum sp. Marseille-Q0166 TaxID=2761105 RepID=UPI001654F8B9|nr:LPS-assembly protein LptD [Ochrobactrum sp. Marseille-Q0166]MBC8717757.1 LPS-assembly protein LptD [Ochrobactrum sp. Marseille-Q0166]